MMIMTIDPAFWQKSLYKHFGSVSLAWELRLCGVKDHCCMIDWKYVISVKGHVLIALVLSDLVANKKGPYSERGPLSLDMRWLCVQGWDARGLVRIWGS